jgi:uncharacterized protein YkwD
MSKRFELSALLLVIVLLVTGCGAKVPPAATGTLPPPAVVTFSPSATPVPPAAATLPPTLQPSPTSQAGCTNRAEFVADVSVPDDTSFDASQSFTKTWRIKNTGTCTWNTQYSLIYLRGTAMNAASRVPFSEAATAPGQTTDLTIDLVAPAQNGTFTGFFEFEDPSGQRFGVKDGDIWVRIVVGGGAVSTPVAGGSPTQVATAGNCTYSLNADFISQVLALINQARVANGLSTLTASPALSAAAQVHSQDMACNNFISHTGTDGTLEQQRIAAQGYSASRSDEAIYAAFPNGGGDPASAVDWWLNEPIHRAILLAPDFTVFGGGYAFVSTSGAGGYFTVDFAKP